MSQERAGVLLPRGGDTIEVDRSADSFTAVVRRPADRRRLEEEGDIERVEDVTRTIARATLPAVPDVEEVRDETMRRLRERSELVVHHEYVTAADGNTTYQITDEVIVRFENEVADRRIAEISSTVGFRLKKAYPDLGNAYLVNVMDDAQANPVKVANRLKLLDETIYAEPVLVNSFKPAALPTDERFPAQWHLYGNYPAAPDVVPDAGASVVEAWAITKGSRDVVIAVLDDGFDLEHPDFMGEGKVTEKVDFVGDDRNPEPEEGNYHGTPCAGVAVAEENDYGCVGVAPGCSLMPVRFPFDAHDSWLIEIFQYVSARAHVASCSWSRMPGYHPINSALKETVSHVAQRGGRDGRGLVVVFAAGNQDAPLDERIDYDIRWPELGVSGRWRTRSQTGRILNGLPNHPSVIAVSACTSLNRKAMYSNWGAALSVAAPSNDSDPLDHNVRRLGRGITTTDNEPPYGDGYLPGKRYTDSFGGTSSACPLVAGVAGLVKSVNPSLGAAAIKGIIESTATKIEDRSRDEHYPQNAFGTYDARGHSKWFGYGKVHAERAVREAARRLPGSRRVERMAPGFPIPDDFRPGACGVIAMPEPGRVADIELAVHVEHEWIGDLRITLASPAGDDALLHEGGANGRRIQRVFAVADAPALAKLIGGPAQGDWVLRVADRARGDTGRVQRWGLRLVVADDPNLSVRSYTALRIPRDDPRGIVSELSIPTAGRLRDLVIDVDVSHPQPESLRVTLRAPGAMEVLLHAGEPGDGDRVQRAFTPRDVPELLALVAGDGRRADGTWRLHVADVGRTGPGKLNGWGLQLTLR